MAKFANSVLFLPTAGGTADFTVSSAVTGFMTPTLAGMSSGTYKYRAESSDLSEWEIGEGAYDSGTGVLTRATVLYNSLGTGAAAGQSGAGSKINFSAPPNVGVVQLTEDTLGIDQANSWTDAQKAQARDNLAVGDTGMTNRIINPNGQIWQRQNSGAAAITDDTYCFDRWYGLTQTAGVTASQVANAEDGTPYMMRLTQANAVAQRFGIAQIIEAAHCLDLRGQTVAISARVRMSAATTLRYAILGWTGAADIVTSDWVLDWTSATFTAGNFFTATNTQVVATGSVALAANTLTTIDTLAATVTGHNNLAVMFWTDSAQAQNVTLDIGKVQLEIGSSATPLALRAYPVEMNLCRRYYQKSFSYETAPAQNLGGFTGALVAVAATASAGAISFRVYLSPQMRDTPTLTTYNTNAANANWWDTNGAASRAVATAEIDKDSFRVVMNASSTAGSQHFIQWKTEAEL